jgi:hypothetical protein
MSYIEREAAIKTIENDCPEAVYYTKRDAIDCIEAQPTADVVEVVRCEHCKYAEYCYADVFDCRCPNAPWASDEYSILTNANDFCSYGERREE